MKNHSIYLIAIGICGVAASGIYPKDSQITFFYIFCFLQALFSVKLWQILPDNPTGRQTAGIFLLALFLRLIFFQQQESDDLYRYIWEGFIQNQGYDPYRTTPLDSNLVHLRTDIWQSINHKDWPAIYPPVAQIFCRLVSLITTTVIGFKSVLTLLDFMTVGILWKILQETRLPTKNIVLYAMHPLILMVFAGEGHIDVLQVFFLAIATLFYLRKNLLLAFFLLGIAISSKYTALLVLPFWLRRSNAQHLVTLALGVYLPFLVYESSFAEITDSLTQFASTLRFNDSLHFIIYQVCGRDIHISTIISLAVAGLGITFFSLWIDDPLRGGVVAFGIFILFSPTVHYWYLSILILFLAMRPNWPFLLLSMTSLFYLNVHNRADFSHSVTDGLLIYLPYFIGCIFWLKSRPRNEPLQTDITLSVVVPFLNEENYLEAFLEGISCQKSSALELIAVDGGASDRSAALFSNAGFRVYSGNGGRGGQIRQGINHAKGDIVLLLHADMKLHSDCFERILNYMQNNPHCLGGALGARFSNGDWRFWIIEFLNGLRARLLGLSFGDQGQFFRRKPIEEEECFREIPIMEDVELSMRMSALGMTVFFGHGIEVSTRRWREKSISGNALLVFRLLIRYLLRRRFLKSDNTEDLFEEYYGRKTNY